MRHVFLAGPMLLTTGLAIARQPVQRTLTFEDRVKAQEAIERVYYSHQIGTKKSFEEAVPRAVLEGKVRKYLDQTTALEVYWRTAVTGETLERELERMARGTRMPDRLRELFRALGDDSVVIQECLARPALVDRLVRESFANDDRIHSAKRAVIHWDDWWNGARQTLLPSKSVAVAARDRPLPPMANATTDSNWSPISTANAPSARELPATVWTGSLMIVWGGDSHSPYFHDTGGRYDPATDSWAPTTTTNAPAARAGPTAVWTGVVMVVWGGSDTSDTALNTGGSYDPLTDTWTATTTVDAPSPRTAHAVVWTGSVMVVWGGTDFNNILNTGGRYDPAADTWTPVSTSDAPSARIWPGAVWTGSQLLVWGGFDGAPLDSGGQYDPKTDVWTSMTATNAPSARYYFSTIWTGSEMIVWGGNDGAALRTGGRYFPEIDEWKPTFATGSPSARWWHSAVWTGSVMVVWGGLDLYSGSAQYNTGGIYDPATDIWARTSTIDAPAARSYHRAIWTGSVMAIWGGWDGGDGSYDQTGGLYVPEPSPDPADNDGDGLRELDGDCDDTSAAVAPGAPQLCDGVNNDCDDPTWPAVPANESDADGDGYRLCQGDCDDTDRAVNPGAVEVCNGLDDDCDAHIDTDGGALCDDANVCTTDECDGWAGCTHVSDVPTCDDDDACTTADTCAGGACTQGDANLDETDFSSGRVDGRDLAILAAAWNTCPGDLNYDAAANLDRLATATGACVDATDFHEFMNAFGRKCRER